MRGCPSFYYLTSTWHEYAAVRWRKPLPPCSPGVKGAAQSLHIVKARDDVEGAALRDFVQHP